MTVARLREIMKDLDGNVEVFLFSDAEGNAVRPLASTEHEPRGGGVLYLIPED